MWTALTPLYVLTKMLTNYNELHGLDATRLHVAPRNDTRNYDNLSLTL